MKELCIFEGLRVTKYFDLGVGCDILLYVLNVRYTVRNAHRRHYTYIHSVNFCIPDPKMCLIGRRA